AARARRWRDCGQRHRSTAGAGGKQINRHDCRGDWQSGEVAGRGPESLKNPPQRTRRAQRKTYWFFSALSAFSAVKLLAITASEVAGLPLAAVPSGVLSALVCLWRRSCSRPRPPWWALLLPYSASVS